MKIPSLICRGKNLHFFSFKSFLCALPKKEMPKDDFDSFAEERMPGFKQTHAQVARQLALYYCDDNGICHPRFKRDLTVQEMMEYAEKWAKKYFVPNPYTPSFADDFNPTCIYSFLYSKRNEHLKYDDILFKMFDCQVNEGDKVKSYINYFTKTIIQEDGTIIYSTNEDVGPINVQINKEDKEAYFKYFDAEFEQRNKSAVPKFVDNLSSTLKSYFPIIRTKPFLLLAGISGTGKSRIVKEMAFASCPNEGDLQKDAVSPGNYLLVEVKPNWHDSTELMGYESSIKKTYVLTPFIKFLYKAMRYPNVPFFVCLDEMNLAPVEQYFAEFLSILESRKRMDSGEVVSEPLISADIFNNYEKLQDKLMVGEKNGEAKNEPGDYEMTDPVEHYRSKEYAQLCKFGLRIPQNVIVVGTVNMDETTHQFSRKVIDRAMTIEMNDVNFDDFFEKSTDLGYVSNPLDASVFLPKYTSAKQALDNMPKDAEYIKRNLPEKLKQLNEALNNTPFKIAYRVQNELVLYLAALREDYPDEEIGSLMASAFDGIMLMKVLPRIEGDGDLLEKPLKELYDFAQDLPKSKAKIEEMQSRLTTAHFTSFWP